MNLIVKMVFGSHLYGTNTPLSDKDYKGVFMPSEEDILLGKIPRSMHENTKQHTGKNTPDDIDIEYYSLHHFISLACAGETAALDMLHAPSKMILQSSDIWEEIQHNREKFYTKNIRAFIGYARRQAAKYGIKGSRLNNAKAVMDFLRSYPLPACRLGEVWDKLPTGEHILKHPPNDNGERMLEVCGRRIGENVSMIYAYDIVKRFYDSYGARAQQAANNKNIDWKAVSHAFRAAYEVRSIFTKGTIEFPLPESGILILIKNGAYDYLTEVAPDLEKLMDEVETLAAKSTLPEKVDREFWNRFIIEKTRQVIQHGENR